MISELKTILGMEGYVPKEEILDLVRGLSTVGQHEEPEPDEEPVERQESVWADRRRIKPFRNIFERAIREGYRIIGRRYAVELYAKISGAEYTEDTLIYEYCLRKYVFRLEDNGGAFEWRLVTSD